MKDERIEKIAIKAFGDANWISKEGLLKFGHMIERELHHNALEQIYKIKNLESVVRAKTSENSAIQAELAIAKERAEKLKEKFSANYRYKMQEEVEKAKAESEGLRHDVRMAEKAYHEQLERAEKAEERIEEVGKDAKIHFAAFQQTIGKLEAELVKAREREAFGTNHLYLDREKKLMTERDKAICERDAVSQMLWEGARIGQQEVDELLFRISTHEELNDNLQKEARNACQLYGEQKKELDHLEIQRDMLAKELAKSYRWEKIAEKHRRATEHISKLKMEVDVAVEEREEQRVRAEHAEARVKELEDALRKAADSLKKAGDRALGRAIANAEWPVRARWVKFDPSDKLPKFDVGFLYRVEGEIHSGVIFEDGYDDRPEDIYRFTDADGDDIDWDDVWDSSGRARYEWLEIQEGGAE